MSLVGRPDWHHPVLIGDQTAYAAYDRPGHCWLPPARWVAVDADRRGGPALRVDLYQQDAGDQGLTSFALLNLRLRAEYDLVAARTSRPDLSVEALVADRATMRLTAPADLDLPDAVREPQPLDPSALLSPALSLRLDATAAEVFVAALQRGLATVTSTAWVQVDGVAARCPGRVVIDAPRLLDAIASSPSPGAPEHQVALTDLAALLRSDPSAAGVTVHTSDQPSGQASDQLSDPSAVELAVLDRVLTSSRAAAPPPDRTDAWVDLSALRGTSTFDLTEALLTPHVFTVPTDPLGPLRGLTAQELARVVLTTHQVPSLPTGWHRLTFSPLTTTPLYGVVDQTIEVTAPPLLPDRPQTARAGVTLNGPQPVAVDLRLSARESLSFRWAQTSVLDGGSDVAVITGDEHPSTATWTAVPPDPALRYVDVVADPSLLAIATVDLRLTAERAGSPWVVTGTVSADAPSVTLVLPGDAGPHALTATATHATGVRLTSPPYDADRVRLDPFSFPGTGPHSVVISVKTQAGPPAGPAATDPVRVEVVVINSDRPPAVLTVGPSASVTFGWYALSPFQTAVRWRPLGGTAWSEPTSTAITVVDPDPTDPAPTEPVRP